MSSRRRVGHVHKAMNAAMRGQCRVAAVHLQSGKPNGGSSSVERSSYKRAIAVIHESCPWSAAHLAGSRPRRRKKRR